MSRQFQTFPAAGRTRKTLAEIHREGRAERLKTGAMFLLAGALLIGALVYKIDRLNTRIERTTQGHENETPVGSRPTVRGPSEYVNADDPRCAIAPKDRAKEINLSVVCPGDP